jgi:hypothetical protein
MNWKHTTFSKDDIKATSAPMKVGILATINPLGEPHLSLISSLRANTENQMVWGQFTEGLSKKNVSSNPKTGFLIMSLDKDVWMGQATWTHTETNGPEYERYNNEPMFRYNAYFGIHTVHFMNLEGQSGKVPLPMSNIIFSALKTKIAELLYRTPDSKPVMNDWTKNFLGKMNTLKYISFIDANGFPVVFPAIQAQSANAKQIVFSSSVFPQFTSQLVKGSSLALYGMSLNMETVLIRGKFQGYRRMAGIQIGVLNIDWVYNSMPPVPGQVYPRLPLETITEF